eukprot:TRINITY_DN2834_c0_g1_i3.p1 TRINITY_DN2834_c0_g1~~TRINITY_DN2834_c0_g1_i3.p1  ORF type:complete len:131 (-),score=17.52 TRINITY_DN2834_c0_g1_i3:138-530(-)
MSEKQPQKKDDLEGFLASIVPKIPGLKGIAVTDREGVTIAKAGTWDHSSVGLPTVFSSAVDHIQKCGIGNTKTLTTFYEDKLVVYINHFPLVIALIGDERANCGLMISIADQLKRAVDPLCAVVENEINE